MENKITFRGVRWLLLAVFYLQLIFPRIVEWKWYQNTSASLPDWVIITAVQLLTVLAPCFVFVYLNSAGIKESFNLRPAPFSTILKCVAIGAAAQPIAILINIPALLVLPVTSVPAPFDTGQLWQKLLFMAAIPAVCEELLMRGVVLSAVKTKGYRASLIISGLYFALLHTRIENFAGMFFLAILLCYIVWMTRSVICGIAAHFAFNACAVAFEYIAAIRSEKFIWVAGALMIVLFFILFKTIDDKTTRRVRSHNLMKQVALCVVNLPIGLIVLGYILFQIYNFK